VTRTAEKRKAYRFMVGKTERWRPIGRRRCRWEHNIQMNLEETGLTCGDRIHLAQNLDL
jgi:hypothetical protein